MTGVSEGATVRTLVELTTHREHRTVPAGTVAYVALTLSEGEAYELDVAIGNAEHDIATATATQIEPIS